MERHGHVHTRTEDTPYGQTHAIVLKGSKETEKANYLLLEGCKRSIIRQSTTLRFPTSSFRAIRVLSIHPSSTTLLTLQFLVFILSFSPYSFRHLCFSTHLSISPTQYDDGTTSNQYSNFDASPHTFA